MCQKGKRELGSFWLRLPPFPSFFLLLLHCPASTHPLPSSIFRATARHVPDVICNTLGGGKVLVSFALAVTLALVSSCLQVCLVRMPSIRCGCRGHFFHSACHLSPGSLLVFRLDGWMDGHCRQ
ncbi:hypothetical protein B0T20DRAFT_3528 [Sordaria brevicollis]|uniref:Secreted protein n=1 Tax=Sordaria brevicollis TaxID=83679 RepID=A0AAE0PMC0_SORBR|nr:hypothetical protein B0T20DRAFT_3528 [Sordaria brevicollis]